MKAMLLRACAPLDQNPKALSLTDMPRPIPAPGEVLIRVSACGVCHTELDEIEGRMAPPHLPVIPGHQVVGLVEEINDHENPRLKATKVASTNYPIKVGDRVGVAWIHAACGQCEYCIAGYENLCPEFIATGRDVDGGYSQYLRARIEYIHPIPEVLSDVQAAPLLCAGAIGYRSIKLTGIEDGEALGLAGFGASGHLTLKIARSRYPGTPVYVFSRNPNERQFALALGAVWSGNFDQPPPVLLKSIIDTTPVWKPVMHSMSYLKPGGRLVINGIRKEESDKQMLHELDYASQLWMEKEIKSVANVARQDVREMLDLAAETGIRSELQEYPLIEANKALLDLKQGKVRGAKVLRVES